MSASLDHYRPSGRVGIKTFAVTVAAMAGSVLVAWVYQLLMNWIPFIYLDALLVFGFAAVLAMAATLAADLGHCRNPIVGGVFGLLLGAVAWGATFYWAYRRALGEVAEGMEGVALDQIAEQLPFSAYLDARIEAGWNIKSANMNGIVVYIVWAIEGLSLLGASAYMFYTRSKEAFCEEHKKWHGKETVSLLGVTEAELKPLIDAGDLAGALDYPQPTEPNPNAKISFERLLCDQCPDKSFLTVTAHTFTQNKKGELEEKKSELAFQVTLSTELTDKFTARRVTGNVEGAIVNPTT